MCSYDDRRKNHTTTLKSDVNPSGKVISTSDIGLRTKPQHTVATFGTQSKNQSTYIMNLRNKFGSGDQFQVHSHDGTQWHQVPIGVKRTQGDQVPLSPRSNQSMTDKFFKK